jgi:hypothetical protein
MKRLTRQQAISKNCRDCLWDHHEPGTWIAQPEACTSPDCALYPYRPISERVRKDAPQSPVSSVSDDIDVEERIPQ